MNIDDEYVKKVAHERRIRQQALAFLRRGKNAGIPDRYLRTTKYVFQNMLCNKYHNNVERIASLVFDTSDKLLKIPYVLIDGGTSMIRTQIGCSVLFRMIACDKNGIYTRCDKLAHKMEDIGGKGRMSRNEFIDIMQDYDSMFIGEIKSESFNEHLLVGSFMDELLGYRFDNMLPTIFSFTKPLSESKEGIHINVAGETISTLSVKEYAGLDNKVTNPTNNFLRIRVKNI